MKNQEILSKQTSLLVVDSMQLLKRPESEAISRLRFAFDGFRLIRLAKAEM